MGLPLFIAPVDPHAISKATDKNAAQSRSSIRRPRRFHYVRRPWPEMSVDSNNEVAGSQPRAPYPNVEAEHSQAVLSFERHRSAPLPSDGQSMPPVPESRDYSLLEPRNTDAVQRITDIRDLQETMRGQAAQHLQSQGTSSPHASPRSMLDAAEDVQPDRPTPMYARYQSMRNEIRRRSPHQTHQLAQLHRLRGYDRDRALSPGDAGAWNTLLTGITPDPQPPSAGSSFASSSASAAATSASTSPASAIESTTVTTPDRYDESAAPPAGDCDVLIVSSDSEEDLGGIPELVNVEGSGNNLSNEDERRGEEHLDTMHRLISLLADRPDIPESWWAEAGLRREPTA